MSEYREERVVSETTDPVVTGPPVRRGNPTPIIAGILIALLLLFLVLFGLNKSSNGDSKDDGVRVTVPKNFDNNDSNDGNSGSTGGSGSSGGSTQTTAKAPSTTSKP